MTSVKTPVFSAAKETLTFNSRERLTYLRKIKKIPKKTIRRWIVDKNNQFIKRNLQIYCNFVPK